MGIIEIAVLLGFWGLANHLGGPALGSASIIVIPASHWALTSIFARGAHFSAKTGMLNSRFYFAVIAGISQLIIAITAL